VGWTEYLGYKNQTLSWLDESVFEWAHLVAGMAQVDGAVAITQQFELIGFGAEISGKLDRVDTVAKALDPEGRDLRQERADCVGTRHHSAYSLCNALHDVLALVVSQDGTVQLARRNRGMVTIWDQLSPSLIDV
jgi:DNA integrity scanning protein DisA with diadenylate cyclase activity